MGILEVEGKDSMREPSAKFVTLAAFAALALLSYGGSAKAEEASPTLVVIVNPEVPITTVKAAQLRSIFLGKVQTWPDGTPIVALVLPQGSRETAFFDERILKMSGSQLERFWVDQKIRGQSGKPKVVPSAMLLHRVVSRTKGAIAFIRKEHLRPGVREVPIDGKSHGDSGYVLRP